MRSLKLNSPRVFRFKRIFSAALCVSLRLCAKQLSTQRSHRYAEDRRENWSQLEEKLQAKLKDSWITETRNRSKESFIRNRSANAQGSEVRVIENIECLSTQLD